MHGSFSHGPLHSDGPLHGDGPLQGDGPLGQPRDRSGGDSATAGDLRAGAIAHDFNNVLTSILGHAELLERSNHLSSLDRRRIDQIRYAVQSAGRLVRRLVEPSDHPAGADEAPVLVLPDAIEQTLSILSPLLGERIESALEVQAMHTSLRLERSQLDQLLVNLVVNAVEAMPEGGTLGVRVTDVTFSSEEADALGVADGPYLRIEVSDTGIGMTPSVMERALEPSFTTKAAARGTGRGLAIVAAIMDQLGGAVSIASTIGSGTTVTLHLPRHTELLVPSAGRRVPRTAPPAGPRYAESGLHRV